VKREKYTDELVEQVLEILIDFIKEVLGERNDDFSEDISSNSRHLGSSSQQP